MKLENEQKLIYVNAIYDNDKAININGAIKENDDADGTKVNLTIGKSKVNGEPTVAYTNIVEVPEFNRIKSMEAHITSTGEYKGRPQARLNKISSIVLLTDEEFLDKQNRLEEFKKKQEEKETITKELEEVSVATKINDVPGDL